MLLFQIEGSNALFECQQTLIDLRSIDLCLLIRVHSVRSSLTACQVNESKLSEYISHMLNLHLQDGMRSGAIGIGSGLPARPAC